MQEGCGRDLSSKTKSYAPNVRACVSVYLRVCVFLNICSSLALFSLLYMAHPCRGCSSSEKETKTTRKNIPAAISAEWILPHCRGISISWFLRAPALCSYPLFSLCFPSLFFSFPLSASPVALLAPSASLKTADVGSVSRCFVFITLQSHLQQTLIQ